MKKIDFLTLTIRDFTWRQKELIDIQSHVDELNKISYFYTNKSGEKRKNPNHHLTRNLDIIYKSFIVILYSHWEGFVKYTGKKYLEFLLNQGLDRKGIDKIFLDDFLKTNKDKMSDVFDVILNDKPIPINLDMIKHLQNLNIKEFQNYFKLLGLSYDEFLKMFEDKISSITGLEMGDGFIDRVRQFKKTSHYLRNYIKTDHNSVSGIKTLEEIIGNDKPSGLVTLRHKIAHGAHDTININYDAFIALSNLTILLIEIFKDSINKQIEEKFKS